MGTIESKLSYLLRTKEEIREAIIGKGVNVAAEDTFRSYADKIRAIVGTEYYVPSLPPEAVNFKDYDGGVLHTYTKDEFLALTEMPELPERPRLVCQGWNWSLEDAKAYVEEHGVLDIGATYITDDGKTRFYIKVERGRKSFPIKFSIDKASSLVIDWGDGAIEPMSGSGSLNVSHTYDAIGDYVISFEVAEGAALSFGSSSSYSYETFGKPYSNMLKKVELGERVKVLYFAFNNCFSLSSVVIPNSVTSISDSAFNACNSLSSVVIPNSVTSIGNSAFNACNSLSSVVIPNGVTSISDSAFNACNSLSSVVIPNGVTSIGSSAFNNCNSLSSVVIPNGVTSIGSSAFYNCNSLSSVVIPNGVTSIGNSAFNNCISIALFDFRTHTSVPTLSNYNAFSNIASDCKIVVPDELYDSWIAATNWSNSNVAKYIVKASEFNG